MIPRPEDAFDIWEHVVTAVNAERNFDIALTTLQHLSLTCRAMVPLCRKHLFSAISLTSASPERSIRLQSVLSNNPQVVQYVRNLWCALSNPIDPHMHAILEALKDQTSVLTDIHIHPTESEGRLERLTFISWAAISTPTRLVLEQLIQLPSVTSIEIFYTLHIPATIFHCPNITRISLSAVELVFPREGEVSQQRLESSSRPISLEEFQSSEAIGTLMQARSSYNDGRSIVDFSGLLSLNCEIRDIRGRQTTLALLRISLKVRTLQLTVPRDVPLQGIGNALSALRFLQCLTLVRRNVTNDSPDPIAAVVEQLQSITCANSLEEIRFSLGLHLGPLISLGMNSWSSLDATLTESRRFPKLKLVALRIIWPCLLDISEDEKTGLLTLDHLPRLVKSATTELRMTTRNQCWCGQIPCRRAALAG